MRRGVSAATLAAMGGVFHPVVMVWLDWPGGEVRAHSGTGTIAWGGEDWAGVGAFGVLDVPAEAAGLFAVRAGLTLHGVPPAMAGLLGVPVRNRRAAVYAGVVTERAGNVLIGDPVEVFSGYMDARSQRIEAGDGEISHSVRLEVASGPSARSAGSIHHTYEDQITRYPGDTGGRHLIRARERAQKLQWPAP